MKGDCKAVLYMAPCKAVRMHCAVEHDYFLSTMNDTSFRA
jgi:hypothetical protein